MKKDVSLLNKNCSESHKATTSMAFSYMIFALSESSKVTNFFAKHATFPYCVSLSPRYGASSGCG